MKQVFRRIILIMTVFVLAVAGTGFPVRAAGSARISFSDVSCQVGETFTVNMSVNATGASLAALDAVLQYPTDYLELVSCSIPSPGSYNSPGGGTIIISWYDASGSGTLNCSLQFKSLKAGSTAVTVASQDIADTDGNVISSSAASSAISIGAQSTASGDANLSALQISPGQLSPAFSPDRTEYAIQVNNDVNKIAVSAKPNDDKAQFVVSSTDLAVGDNTITVKVTAEDGKTVKTYTIRVKRLEAAATTTKASESSRESTEQSSETESEQETGETNGEDITIMINGQTLMFVTELDGVALPEGYEVTDYEFDSHSIQAGRNSASGQIIFYLADQDGENPRFYLYHEQDKTFTRMMNIQTASHLYTVMEPGEDVTIPEGYHEITVEIDGLDVRAWQSNEDMDGIYYLIYAMNTGGEKALYRYDAQEKTLQRADPAGLTGQSRAPEMTETSTDNLQSRMDQEGDGTEKELPGWVKYVVIGFLILIIILTLIMLFLKNRDSGGRGGWREGDFDTYRERRQKNGHRTEHEDDYGEQQNEYENSDTGLYENSPSAVQDYEMPEQPHVNQPNASELSSMLNRLDHEKDDDDFEIFDL